MSGKTYQYKIVLLGEGCVGKLKFQLFTKSKFIWSFFLRKNIFDVEIHRKQIQRETFINYSSCFY